MKLAVVSDIHGNLPALDAVIKDAQNEKVDCFVFVGDYCLSNPFPDGCISRMRRITNKYIIRGNEERYLENLIGKDQSTWVDGQMQISYWNFQNIGSDNLSYVLSLPTHIKFECNGMGVHVAHSSADFIGEGEFREWGTAKVAERYSDKNISPSTFREDIHTSLKKDEEFKNELAKLEEGIYIFGHTHIQWSFKTDDGKKILINPGSCGLPLDCIANGMPYTIIEIRDRDKIIVEERRVPFDMEAYLEIFRRSDQYIKANVWSKIIEKELRTGREHLTFFLKFAEEYATKTGDMQRPFSVKTWEKAYEIWERGYK